MGGGYGLEGRRVPPAAESDPETIQQLHAKARQDATWVLEKVCRGLCIYRVHARRRGGA